MLTHEGEASARETSGCRSTSPCRRSIHSVSRATLLGDDAVGWGAKGHISWGTRENRPKSASARFELGGQISQSPIAVEEVLFSCSPQIAVLRSQRRRRRPTAVRLVCSDSVRPFPKQRRCLSSLVILLGLLPFGRAVKRTEEMSTFDSDCQAAERFLHI